jgi:hypothetical protein
LSAGPVSYGPATAADDVVTDHSLPSILQLSRRFSERAELSKHLAVELAALTLNTARMLLAPPVSQLQPPPPSVLTTTPSALTTTPSALTIVALRISDRADAAVGSSAMARSALNEAELADDRAWEAELENLKTELRPLAAHGQTLNIETVDTSLEDCHLCAAALGESWNHWATIPATFILSVFLFGVEEVGIQIEEPFSILPLEAMCNGAIEAVQLEMLAAEQSQVFEAAGDAVAVA